MMVALAIFLGLVWGLLAALLGGLVTRRAMAKNTEGAMIAVSLLRTVIDLVALGLIFLLRKVLPFDYTWMMLATAVSLSLGTIVISFRIAKK